jgi:hypothetical protein
MNVYRQWLGDHTTLLLNKTLNSKKSYLKHHDEEIKNVNMIM